MVYYRLRPGVTLPSFRAGELYALIEPTVPDGYVFADVGGKRRCIDTLRHFEAVEGPDPSSPPDQPLTG
jgi:hypothetical protein